MYEICCHFFHLSQVGWTYKQALRQPSVITEIATIDFSNPTNIPYAHALSSSKPKVVIVFSATPMSSLPPWKQPHCTYACPGAPFTNIDIMMTSSNGNIFRVTGPLCSEFTGRRWNPIKKASDAELWSAPWINGWVNNLRLEIWDTIALIMTSLWRTSTPALMSNHMPNKMWDETTYSFSNPTVEVCGYVLSCLTLWWL